MGKQAGASPEELEFIFELFLRGLENKEVLHEMEDKEFPKRNARFIRDRRRHFDAAKKVLEKQGQIQIQAPNWIEDYEKQHGELPFIPEFMVVVKNCTGTRISEGIEISVPSAQWWNNLLPSQKEQVLQTVDWLCKHKKDWRCKNREDYLAMIKRCMPGASPMRIIPKYKMA